MLRVMTVWMMVAAITATVFATLGPNQALAELDDPETGNFANLTIADGLYDADVASAAIDQQGFAWIGTAGGALQRWDGTRLQTFRHDPANPDRMAPGRVSSIAVDAAGDVWFLAGSTLHRVDTGSLTITKIVAMDYVSKIFAVGERLYGIGVGLYEIVDDTAVLVEDAHDDWVADEWMQYVGELPNGRLLISAAEQNWEFDPTTGRATLSTIDYHLRQVVRDGTLASAHEGGLDVTDLDSQTTTNFQLPFPSDDVLVAIIDAQQRIWVSGFGHGIVMFDREEGSSRWFRHDPKQASSLLSDHVEALVAPADGSVWWASIDRGISIYAPQAQGITHLDRGAELSDNRVSDIASDERGQVWVGTLRGIDLIRGTDVVSFDALGAVLPPGRQAPSISTITIDDAGRVVTGSYIDGLWRYDPITKVYQQLSAEPPSIGALHTATDGSIWIGADGGGIFRWVDEGLETVIEPSDPELYGTNVTDLEQGPDGQIVGLTSDGRFFRVEAEQTLRVSRVAASTELHDLELDSSGRWWVATDAGLMIDADGSGNHWTFHPIEVDGRLVSVRSILFNEEGTWLGTSYGLMHYHPNMVEPLIGMLGMNGHSMDGAAVTAVGSTSYFGGTDGVAVIDSAQVDNVPPPPVEVSITDSISDRPIEIAANDTVTVPSSARSITAQVSVLDYVNPESHQLRYRLVGFDSDWVVPERDQRQFTYTNLDPGGYRFVVQIVEDGEWVDAGATLTIDIEAAWWETWWARTLSLLGVIGTAAGVVLIISKRRLQIAVQRSTMLQQQLEERERHAREMELLHTELQHHANRAKALIDAVPGSIVILDANRRVLISRAGSGLPTNESLGIVEDATLNSLFGIDLDQLASSPTDWQEVQVEIDGRTAVYQVYLSTLDTGGGTWVIVFSDVTDDVNARRHLKDRQRMADLGQFAAGIAHDLNNILAVIMMSAELIGSAAQDTDVDRPVALINQYTSSARAMIRQVLDFSQSNDAKLVPHPARAILDPILEGAAALIPDEQRFITSVSPHVDEYAIVCDPVLMQRLVFNLVANARDAAARHGTVSVSASIVTTVPDGIIKSMWPPGSADPFLCISVIDDGSGISEEVAATMFEAFESTRTAEGGVGLGLAQVKSIALAHDAVLNVKSELGAGTQIDVYLAAAHLSVTTPAIGDGELSSDAVGATVLLVDDNPSLLALVNTTLTTAGFVVTACATAERALEAWRRIRHDVIVTDLRLEDSNGGEMLALIRDEIADQPAVVMTGELVASRIGDTVPQGVLRLQKPFTGQALVKAVNSVCRERPRPTARR